MPCNRNIVLLGGMSTVIARLCLINKFQDCCFSVIFLVMYPFMLYIAIIIIRRSCVFKGKGRSIVVLAPVFNIFAIANVFRFGVEAFYGGLSYSLLVKYCLTVSPFSVGGGVPWTTLNHPT